MMPPLNRVLNYHGSKYGIAPWILRFAPPHHCFVDLYGGSASILCHKPPVAAEVYNDAGSDVVGFFRMLRERPQDLARAVALTPWSRDEFALCWEPSPDPLEAARRFFVRSWQTRGSGQREGTRAGWRFQRRDSRGGFFVDQWHNLPDALIRFAERMLRVQIEHDDALRVIRRFDGHQTLTFADPPYLPDVRSKWAMRAYEHEMTEAQHVALAEAMQGLEGYGLVCGYASPLYAALYEAHGWLRKEKVVRNGAGQPATECLWISPRTAAALAAESGPLFAEPAGAAEGAQP